MEVHGPRVVVRELPGGAVVAPPTVHLYGDTRDVAGCRGEEETHWARGLRERGGGRESFIHI